MKKLIFYSSIFLLSILFFSANAQNVAIGIQGGISIPNLTSGGSGATPLSENYSSRFGPDFGLYAEFKLADEFSIQPGLEYSSQGGKKDGLQAFPTNPEIAPLLPNPSAQYVYANYNSTAKLNYLMLPILGKYGWDLKSHFRVYVEFGPFLSYLLSANQVTSGSSYLYSDKAGTEPVPELPEQNFDKTTPIKDDLHTFDFGVEGNLGLAYKLKRSYIFVQAGGNYGFFNIQKEAEDGKNETGAATVSLGYSIWIGKPAAETK